MINQQTFLPHFCFTKADKALKLSNSSGKIKSRIHLFDPPWDNVKGDRFAIAAKKLQTPINDNVPKLKGIEKRLYFLCQAEEKGQIIWYKINKNSFKKRLDLSASEFKTILDKNGTANRSLLDIIQKKKTNHDKVLPLVNSNSNNPTIVPKSLLNRISDVKISPGKITCGQGEYVVFHKLPNGEKKALTKEIYEKAYTVLNKFSPGTILSHRSENSVEECENRYEIIKENLKKIDSTLEIMFVPRTLYELIFIRKCIKEDLKNKKICPRVDSKNHKTPSEWLTFFENDNNKCQIFLQSDAIAKLQRKCWHLCCFKDEGDNEHSSIKDVAYRLNQIIVKNITLSGEGITHQELAMYTEKEIQFLKGHLENSENNGNILQCNNPGPTTNFGCESSRGSITSMGIRNESDAQIIRNALALDCSVLAQKSFILYRGTDFQKDSVTEWGNKDVPYSLSYGSSLFAGCIFDGGATAFHFIRNNMNAYAVPVRFDQLDKSPFYIPSTNTLVQLFGIGEAFHCRTKPWKDFDLNKIGGINSGVNNLQRDHLISDLTKDELIYRFMQIKKKAIQLK